MQINEFKQAQRFLEEFKAMDFQVPLENMKRQIVQVGKTSYYKDLYLVEKLLPAVIEGLEQLSRQVELLMNEQCKRIIYPEDIDPQVRKRFNPCIFLAQYLMRHNHVLPSEAHPPSHLSKLFKSYCQVQKFNRFFIRRHDSIFKAFTASTGKEKKVCDISELKLFASSLDKMLDLNGALREALSNSKVLNKNKNQIKFNDIVEQIAKFASANHLTEDQFEKIFAVKK